MLATDINYFIEIVKAGGIGRAAEVLGLSQPALSKAVVRLEKHVGTLLLQRTPRGTEVTDAGRAFYEHACTAALNLENGLQVARDTGGGHAGLLRMGMTPGTSQFVLKALFPDLRKERPASTIKLRTAFSGELFEALLLRHLSIVVSPVPEIIPAGLVCEVLYEEKLMLVHNTAHPLAKKRDLSPKDLEHCEMAGAEVQESARSTVRAALIKRGLRLPRVVVETNSLESIIFAVANSPLVTLIPSTFSIERLPNNLMVRPFPIPQTQGRIGVFQVNVQASAIASRAIDLLRAQASHIGTGGT